MAGGWTPGASAPACAKSPTSPTSRSPRSPASSRSIRTSASRCASASWPRSQQLEYEPDFLAQSLRRGATLSVGYVVGDISNPLDRDHHVGCRVGAPPGRLLDAADELGERPRAGRRPHPVLPGAARRRHDPVARERTPLGDPRRPDPGGRPDHHDRPRRRRRICDASIVRNDHKTGMRAAVDHLLDLGHRRIALITGGLDLWPVRERIAGMAEAVAAKRHPRRDHHPGRLAVCGARRAQHRAAAGDGSATDRDRRRRQPGPRRLRASDGPARREDPRPTSRW